MKTINSGFEILTPINGEEVLKHLERCGRVCYKSEDKITPDSAAKFITGIIKSSHETILEHYSVTVLIICDRGVSHEIVRHRLASYSQESTRYCNYSNDKFGNEITFIRPCFFKDGEEDLGNRYFIWIHAMRKAEDFYFYLINLGVTPQEARSVLPNSLKTEIVMTANLREWRHFFKLRALGTTGKPHPQMLEIAVPMLREFQRLIPVVFDDLGVPA